MGTSATASKRRYADKTYDQVRFLVKKGEKEIIKAHADKRGESINAFITRAVKEQMMRDSETVTFD